MKTSLDVFSPASTDDEIAEVSNVLADCIGVLADYTKPFDVREIDTIAHNKIRVTLHPGAEGGDLRTDVPNIVIGGNGIEYIILTWEEARKLCAAIWQMTNLAEFG